MDESFVRSHVEQLRYVPEKTSHLQITLHTDSKYDAIEEGPLADEEILDWLSETGRFAPKVLPSDVKKIASLRFILQTDAQNPHTFDTNAISLPPAAYLELLKACQLSTRAIDSASVIGPLFWYEFGQGADRSIPEPSLQIIFRKTDSAITSTLFGFELIMSHTNLVSSKVIGFYRATRSTEIASNITHLRRSAQEIAHPMLLPIIVLSSNIGPRQTKRQQENREMLYRAQDALLSHLVPTGHPTTSLGWINAELMKCQRNLWKNPSSYHKVIDGIEEILLRTRCHQLNFSQYYLSKNNTQHRSVDDNFLFEVNNRYAQRVEFIRKRLRGIESHCHTTLSKIDVQRAALHNMLLDRQNETALQIEQRRQIEDERKFSASQTWNKNQRTISLLGIFFLPGAFIASIFSTTFFNFQAPPGQTVVSDRFWMFWALTVPVTMFVFTVWWMKERLDKARVV